MECSLSKRRKASPMPSPASINDLTDDNLCAIAKFLPKTSCALLAVALTAPSSTWRGRGCDGRGAVPSAASMAVVSTVLDNSDEYYSRLVDALCAPPVDVGNEEKSSPVGGPNAPNAHSSDSDSHSFASTAGTNTEWENDFKGWAKLQIKNYYAGGWEVLDFFDIDRELAKKLNDDDLSAVLLCIGAQKKLKHLTLTNCFNIVGHGLEVLKQSKALVTLRFDFRRDPLGSFNHAKLFGDARLSDLAVLDVVNGIVSHEGHSFEQILVPSNFMSGSNAHKRGSPNEAFSQFMKKHNAALGKGSDRCYFGTVWNQTRDWDKAHHRPDGMYVGDWSDAYYNSMKPCSSCNELVCQECPYTNIAECSFCDAVMCEECAYEYGRMNSCANCGTANCTNCSEREGAVRPCGGSYRYHQDGDLCTKCQIDSCRDPDEYTCPGCVRMAFKAILKQNSAKDDQIEQLRSELEQLRSSDK